MVYGFAKKSGSWILHQDRHFWGVIRSVLRLSREPGELLAWRGAQRPSGAELMKLGVGDWKHRGSRKWTDRKSLLLGLGEWL
jgi:hypothetical protein